MFGLELNDTVIMEQRRVLEAALSTNPDTQKALQKLIRKVIKEARGNVSEAAGKAMDSDPREAARAVRNVVYRKVLGANINIYNSRKAHGSTSYEPPRTLQPGQRGGNRVPRGGRTAQVMGYDALDRGFILRWLNNGTKKNGKRTAGTRGGRLSGNRGSIDARNWFKPAAEKEMGVAIDTLANLIDTELENILNNKK